MKNILLPLFIGLTITASAQEIHRCYTTEMMQQREQAHPGYLEAAKKTFNQTKEYAQSKSGGQDVYRIPVVFHVLYNTPAENIPDSVLFSQIDVLNEDYRRLNADTNITRTEFKPVAGDARIEFYLASTDPDGNWTNGITRTETTKTSFFGANNDDIKKDANGGKDGWPTDRYLNIWVGDYGLFGIPLVLGYAYPPVGAINWPAGQEAPDPTLEGVVIHYEVVGRNNPLATGPLAVTGSGRTGTHEVGHYLGLRHIWGDGGCNEDDGIDDTPSSSSASQQQCNLNKNTCTDSPTDFNDMIENYMDYSEEACMNMFTNGQIDIIRGTLETTRNPLIADFAAGINAYDLRNIEMNVYPNPSAGVFSVSYDNQSSLVKSVEILDSFGRLVDTQAVSSTTNLFTVDLTGQSKGVYFARFVFAEGSKVSKLIVE